jgi:hypothetical protein
MMPAVRRLTVIMAIAFGMLIAGASSAHVQRQRSTATPIKTTLDWFTAINDKDARKAKSYFAPKARYMINWGPTSTWSTFTKLHCRTISLSRRHADVKCRFHESPSRSEGNPSTWWSFDLHRRGRKWLIDNYGQP